jgi:hypothetical protein
MPVAKEEQCEVKSSSTHAQVLGFVASFSHHQHPVQKFWTKTILLSQTRMFHFSKICCPSAPKEFL